MASSSWVGPGVGKTPMLIVMGLALGRSYICRQGIDGVKPAWRRAKAPDNFRYRVGQIHEALILDDPEVDKLNMSDIKIWMTSEEDATCSGRYNDIKMVRNNARVIASNDLQEQHEPPKDNGRRYITSEEFFTLVSKFLASHKRTDILAVLKRSVVMVFGQHAIYLRLPNQDPDVIIHRIHTDDVHLDLFSPRQAAVCQIPGWDRRASAHLRRGCCFEAENSPGLNGLDGPVQKPGPVY